MATGRMAEVFAWGEGRVLKLDRAEWNGCAALESEVLRRVTEAGIDAPRAFEATTVAGRLGVVMERVDGPLLSEVLAHSDDVDAPARTFSDLHVALNAREVDGLPDLLTSLLGGIEASGLDAALGRELISLTADLDDGRRQLCHFDLHPQNVIVSERGWVVIDWLSASSGPPLADFARTLLLLSGRDDDANVRFRTAVRRDGLEARGADLAAVDDWVRVLAAARLSEGFTGEYASFLTGLAAGTRRLV
ncbi:MAG TPA: phosphotransferase [Acidimicrobiia bacterium]|nr:phosphotransferase [Acidimicrobiia bacterium]